MILHRIIAYLFFFLLISTNSNVFAEIRNFQTTKLKSTAGAGVGAILFEESSFLNPAPLAFYNTSSIYLQKGDANQTQLNNSGNEEKNSLGSKAIIFTDAGGALKGSFSYVKQSYDLDSREQFTGSFAANLGEKSALGASLLVKKDTLYSNGQFINDNYEQAIIGVTHIVDENLNFGLSLYDPFRAKEGETKAIFGMQYLYGACLSFLLDIGADYKEDLEENYIYKAASQIKFLNDFYLRFGIFRDKGKKERGNGIGLSWVSPRLTAEVAQSIIKKEESLDLTNSSEISEFTFSFAFLF